MVPESTIVFNTDGTVTHMGFELYYYTADHDAGRPERLVVYGVAQPRTFYRVVPDSVAQ